MRILYIANLRMPTEKAYGYQIAKMCEAFTLARHQVELVVPKRKRLVKEDFYTYYDIHKNFVFKILPSPDFYWPGKLDRVAVILKNLISAVSLFFYIWDTNSDVVISRDELPIFLASFIKSKVVFEAHKFSASRKIFYARLKRARIKVITISQSLKNVFVDHGFRESDIMVAHDGVDPVKFDIDISRDDARQRTGLPSDKILLGYVGHLKTMGMDKGLDILFWAVAILQKEITNLGLVIVGGSNADIADYQKLSINIGVGDKVWFVGHQPRYLVPVFLKAFDILVMPFPRNIHYDLYMSPLKLFEYMISQRPIIASKLKTIAEVLDETCAILVTPDDERALADGILKLIQNPQLAQSVLARAYERVKNFTWQKRAEKIIEFVK